MSDSLSIQNQFHTAVRYQANSTNTITVLLLDEVGLAEHSPDMPLKCLHGMLVDPPISIVGLSNWVLDSAKMNRAILVQRPEPTCNDITITGASIAGLSELPELSETKEEETKNTKKQKKNKTKLCFSSFSHLLEKTYKFKIPPVSKLITTNLQESDSRHLMLLTQNSSALWLLFNENILNIKNTKVIIGSQFPEDKTELYLIQQMNEVKLSMAAGEVVVLMNADNMYEALYDVLNQRYLTKKNQNTGEIQKFLRLAIGSKSSLCQVKGKFLI